MGSSTTAPPLRHVPARSFWAFAAAYVALVLVGRSTALTESGPALVWPAAGLALVWLLARPGRRWTVAVLVATAVVTPVLHLLTGAAPGLVVAGTCVALAQPVVAVALLRRFRPDLLGVGGRRTISDPRVLVTFVAVVVTATGVGALLATAALSLTGLLATPLVAAEWWGRNLAGMLLVGASGHLLLHALATGTPVAPRGRRVVELVLVTTLGVATFLLIDVGRGQPPAFLLIATSVWCALRFSTVVASLQVVGSGILALTLVLAGGAPLTTSPGPVEVLTLQVFVVTLLLVTLAIASNRDQRDGLVRQLDTSRREAAARARHLEAVTDVMAEGLTVLDVDANLVRMNSAARAILDRTPAGTSAPTAAGDYVVMSPDGTVLPPEAHPAVRAISEGRVGPEDIVLAMEDGTRRTLSVTAEQLTEGGEPAGSVVVFHDVTEERRQTDQLAEFAATAAHDLRSPLTALRGWVELAAETASPEGAVALGRARDAALRMQELITDLLEQASAEGGLLSAAELEAVPLDLVLDDVAAYLPEGAVLEGDDDLPVVSAHPEMLRQLFMNLLGNATKYVAPGVRPRVVVTAVRAADRVVIEVRDNGIGIPAGDRAKVFDRLYRAHSGDRQYAGTGLGLAICRTVVVRHGGHILCRPGPRGGTVFVFDLPAAVPDVPVVAPAIAPAAPPVPEDPAPTAG